MKRTINLISLLLNLFQLKRAYIFCSIQAQEEADTRFLRQFRKEHWLLLRDSLKIVKGLQAKLAN